MPPEEEPKYAILQVLDQHWWVIFVALVVGLIAVPIARTIAYRYKIVDRPDDLLKSHKRPIAYLGGMGMLVALLMGLVFALLTWPDLSTHWDHLVASLQGRGPLVPPEHTILAGKSAMETFGPIHDYSLLSNPIWRLSAIMLSCIVITLVGLLDDLVNLKPRQKIYGQLIAAALLLVGGVADRMSLVILSPLFYLWGAQAPYWLIFACSTILCVIVVVSACNATNLLDGLDGLCGGVTGIIAAGFLCLAVWLAMFGHFPWTGDDNVRLALCLAMMGAVLGFLPYNFPPASIFMGDAGSMLLGFFVAIMMAMFCHEGTARWFLGACVVFALPMLDTGLAVIRRARAGKNIFSGDRSHLYDQLVDRGLSVKQVVGLFYVLAGVAAVIGVVISIWARMRLAIVIYIALLAMVLTICNLFGMMTPPPKESAKKPEPSEHE